MCGIVAWIGHGEEARTEGEDALARLATRGPDGHALWIDKLARIGLGNARLAILDPRPVASQPMVRGDARLTHNGEIYNFIELRAELEAQGERFTTRSDTEVLLAGYRVWGDAMLPRLNGMWAFALWDPALGKLLVSRDRLGVKPLFIARGDACVHVASEIKALLAFRCLRWGPDLELLRGFVATGLTADGSRETFFEGIQRIPPASAIWMDARTRTAVERRFWTLSPDREVGELGMAEAASRLEELLTDAVRLRLRSDVPVGLSLSGGIDSSAVAGALRRLGPTTSAVRAFSVHWRSSVPDGAGPLIAQALAASGLEGESAICSADELPAMAEDLVWHQDEPFAQTVPFSGWLVYRLAARAGVHVLLEGQGADELFAGYHVSAFGGRFADLALSGSFSRLRSEVAAFSSQHGAGLRRAALYAGVAVAPPALVTKIRELRWGSSGFGRRHNASQLDRAMGGGDRLRRALRRELTTTNLPALLRYADRSSMAHSVEVRLPFLDHRVVEFASGLASELLVGQGQTKRVLRALLRRTMPGIAEHPSKVGFIGPEAEWIRGPLRPWIADLVTTAEVRGVYPAGAASSAWSAVLGRRVQPQLAWRIAIAELWMRRYADAHGRPPT